MQDRRKERERRMTQEVSLLKQSPSVTEEAVQYSSQTLPHPRRGTEPVPRPRTSSFESKVIQLGDYLKKMVSGHEVNS